MCRDKFSVLMSIYNKEKPKNFIQCMDSILVKQELKPYEIILVEDGRLTSDLYKVIDDYKIKFPNIIKTLKLKENKGLGIALKEGMKIASCELIARMDTDDICSSRRFKKQVGLISKHDDLDLVGSNMSEFIDDLDNIISKRDVPEKQKDIEKMLKRRNPVNHISVIFRKSAVIESGGYRHFPYMEDYDLWCRMLANGKKFYNIQEVLVYARVGKDMLKRRSFVEQKESYKKIQKFLAENKYNTNIESYLNIFMYNIFNSINPSIKKYIYKYILRK